MTARPTYSVVIGDLRRELPLFEVAPGVSIAVFNMLGDTLVIKAAAAALADRLVRKMGDVIVTAEAKSIPLAHELSGLLGLPYIVLRKTYRSYMGDALSVQTNSITTGSTQHLFLDEKDRQLLKGAYVILIDDVISTGSTLKGMRDIVEQAQAEVSAVAAVFTEGDQDWSDVIALDNLPVFTAPPNEE